MFSSRKKTEPPNVYFRRKYFPPEKSQRFQMYIFGGNVFPQKLTRPENHRCEGQTPGLGTWKSWFENLENRIPAFKNLVSELPEICAWCHVGKLPCLSRRVRPPKDVPRISSHWASQGPAWSAAGSSTSTPWRPRRVEGCLLVVRHC